MKAARSYRQPAFTVIELLLMVFTLAILFVLLFSSVPRARKQAHLKQCFNNLKEINYEFRLRDFDSNDRFHMQIPTSQGGSLESITNGAVFHTFQVMSNEFNSKANVLVCPSDNRVAARDFTNSFSNANISYFVGVDATDTEMGLFLSGDRNLTNGPLTSTRLLTLTTNSLPGWDDTMHNQIGNISMADGSTQTYTIPQLRLATRNMAGPSFRPDIRLAFP